MNTTTPLKFTFLISSLTLLLWSPLKAVLLDMSEAAPEEMLCVGNHWTPNEANLMMKEFASTWDNKRSWEKRADMIRQGILEGLRWDHMPNIKGHFNPIIHSRREMDGYVVENIAIESFPGFWITGNLYSPLIPKAKNPAILNPHGHLANKRFTDYMQIRCAAFARMGAIAFTYDMVGYAESTQTTHKMPIAALLQTWNSTRVLEYLLSRPDVDPDHIGMTGGSGGGTQTFVLTAIDDRITVSAPVVQVSAHFFGGCVCESGMPIHKSNQHQTNNVELAAMAAPRPLLLVSNGADWTRNTPRIEYPYVQSVYALYNAEHNVENVHLPLESHDYGFSKRAAAYGFFAHHLGLGRKGIPYNEGWDESFVTILSTDELRVFNDAHPRPTNILMGDEAVMSHLGFKYESPK
ncbi:MAG: acetylxylan esterase [Verrucomicrobia bacterium]|nr:acetylxylan esterase [Verrucomicrobiota bacterium]MDA1067066.1 acetylxylan esterase [Verrucomicrobiota bacterium]